MSAEQADPILEYTVDELAQATEAVKALTPEEFLGIQGMLAQYQTQLSQVPLPEAPCIVWMDLSTADGDVVNFTVRGHLPEATFDNFTRGLKHAKRKYGLIGRQKRYNQGRTAAPPPATPVAQQSELTPAPSYVPVTSPGDPGATPDSRSHVPGQTFIEELAYLEVTPLAGGAVKLGFVPYMRNGRPGKYATAYEQLKTPAEWVQLFTGFAAEVLPGQWRTLVESDFKVAAKYNFQVNTCEVDFVVSERKNGSGNYFVNLKRILPKI